MRYAVEGYPNEREFEIVDRRGKRVRVEDGITRARWVPKNNVAPIGDETKRLLRTGKFIKESDLQKLRKQFFLNELGDTDLIEAYIERGMPAWLAVLAIGYKEENFPYRYTEREPHQTRQHVFKPATSFMFVQHQVATSKPFSDVNSEPQSAYGSPSVLAQWVHYDFYPEADVQRVIREESERIDEKTYVVRRYSNVSQLGELDGELDKISVYRYKNNLEGWRGYSYIRKPLPNGDYKWVEPRYDYAGEPYLNGAMQMQRFNQGPIDCLKGE